MSQWMEIPVCPGRSFANTKTKRQTNKPICFFMDTLSVLTREFGVKKNEKNYARIPHG